MRVNPSASICLRGRTRRRERRASFIAKEGFSVVAPIKINVPFSTKGRKRSCCALFKRWISSRKKMHLLLKRGCASMSSMHFLSSVTVKVVLKCTKRASKDWAYRRARVVFPQPGGPQRRRERGAFFFMLCPMSPLSPKRCSWPTTSSKRVGLSRSAKGTFIFFFCLLSIKTQFLKLIIYHYII